MSAAVLSVTFVTCARPKLAAEPDGIENLDPAGRGEHETLRPEFRKHARHDFANRSHAVGEILLADEGRHTTGRRRAGRREIEKMAGHALANRCERVACELFEHVVEAMHGFLGECPRDCGIVTGGAFDARDVEEERGDGGNGLDEDGSGAPDQSWNTQETSGPHIADGHLPAVARVHVDANETAGDHCEGFGVGFRIDGVSGRTLGGPSADRQTFDRPDRQMLPAPLV